VFIRVEARTMADLEIDFESEVAAKYELIPATADVISKLRENSLLREIPENQWPFYCGTIVPIGKSKSQRLSGEKLGSAVRTLVAGLAGKTEPFHVIALKVVHDLGLDVPDSGSPPHAWHWLAASLRFMFEGRSFWAGKEYKWPHPIAQKVGELGIFLVPDKDNKPVLALRPDNLFDALTLVAARMIATGTTFNICDNCKTPFLTGGSRGRNKRRGDARFCSDRCRYEFHNHRKAR
jgi:hypothetical protein